MSQDSLISNHLYRLRRNRRLSQKRLAYLVGASVRALSDYERGRRLPPLALALLLEIVLSAKASEIYVDLYQSLRQQVVTRDDAFPAGSNHDLQRRLLRKD